MPSYRFECLPKRILIICRWCWDDALPAAIKEISSCALFYRAALALSSLSLVAFLASPSSHHCVLVCYHTSPHRLNALPGQLYLTSPFIPKQSLFHTLRRRLSHPWRISCTREIRKEPALLSRGDFLVLVPSSFILKASPLLFLVWGPSSHSSSTLTNKSLAMSHLLELYQVRSPPPHHHHDIVFNLRPFSHLPSSPTMFSNPRQSLFQVMFALDHDGVYCSSKVLPSLRLVHYA